MTQELILKRQLDNYEEWLWSFGVITTFIYDYTGELDLDALDESCKQLGRRYPIFRAQVIGENHTHTLESTDSLPQLKILNGPEKENVQEILSISRDLRPMVAQFAVRKDGQNGSVIFVNDHTTFDAHATFFYISKLFEIYTNLKAGELTEFDGTGSLPSAPSAILKRRSNDQFLEQTKDSDTTRKVERRWEIRQRIIPFNIDITRELVATCKRNRITVGSAITAAMAHTLLTLHGPRATDSVSVTVTIDLRNHFNPPIRAHETTNLMVRRPIEIKVDLDNIINTARNYITKMSEEKSTFRPTDRIYRNDVSVSEVEQFHKYPPKGDFEVNNAGKYPRIPTPDDLKLIAFRIPDLSKTEEGPVTKSPHPYRLGSWTLNRELEVFWWGLAANDDMQKLFVDNLTKMAKSLK